MTDNIKGTGDVDNDAERPMHSKLDPALRDTPDANPAGPNKPRPGSETHAGEDFKPVENEPGRPD